MKFCNNLYVIWYEWTVYFPHGSRIKEINYTLRNLLLDSYKTLRTLWKEPAICICLRKIKSSDNPANDLHGVGTYHSHILPKSFFRGKRNKLTLKEFGSLEKYTTGEKLYKGLLIVGEQNLDYQHFLPKIFNYVNNKNDTKHRDKIYHLTESTLNIYLFSAMSLILIVNIFMMVIILIRLNRKKLGIFECMLREVSAIRIHLPFFF